MENKNDSSALRTLSVSGANGHGKNGHTANGYGKVGHSPAQPDATATPHPATAPELKIVEHRPASTMVARPATCERPILPGVDLNRLPSPAYVIDRGRLEENCRVINEIQERTGCRIILALKGFATYGVFRYMRPYLAGTTASSVNEALLGVEEFGGEVHLYAPAYKDTEIERLLKLADHISFNSLSQWMRFKRRVLDARRPVSAGLRINPEYSEVGVPLYDPCCKHSRLGVTIEEMLKADLTGIEGFHFHTHCEQNADALERTLDVIERKFGRWLPQLKWLNFGGGHLIAGKDYDRERLMRIIVEFRARHPNLDIYLEPASGIVQNTGFLVTTVVDTIHNGMDIAILDTSATAHMPDVIEMPYRPDILDAGQPGEFAHTYRLGGLTCLAGDIVGDYSFKKRLEIGDKLVLKDMSHYTMVKNTTFNGIPLPAISIYHPATQEIEVLKTFGYEDYKRRL